METLTTQDSSASTWPPPAMKGQLFDSLGREFISLRDYFERRGGTAVERDRLRRMMMQFGMLRSMCEVQQ